jgi:hypothetical protein
MCDERDHYVGRNPEPTHLLVGARPLPWHSPAATDFPRDFCSVFFEVLLSALQAHKYFQPSLSSFHTIAFVNNNKSKVGKLRSAAREQNKQPFSFFELEINLIKGSHCTYSSPVCFKWNVGTCVRRAGNISSRLKCPRALETLRKELSYSAPEAESASDTQLFAGTSVINQRPIKSFIINSLRRICAALKEIDRAGLICFLDAKLYTLMIVWRPSLSILMFAWRVPPCINLSDAASHVVGILHTLTLKMQKKPQESLKLAAKTIMLFEIKISQPLFLLTTLSIGHIN